jgi:hydrogenase-4 component E
MPLAAPIGSGLGIQNAAMIWMIREQTKVPFLVDAGVLLDVFVGVFVMGIVVFHINREFDSLDSTRLTELHD